MNPDPDFRNTHSITGFCSICPTKPPVVFRIHEGNNDAEQFAIDVELAIGSGYIRPGDVLVLDNAAYHIGRENVVLEDWLWDNHEGEIERYITSWYPFVPRTPKLYPKTTSLCNNNIIYSHHFKYTQRKDFKSGLELIAFRG